MWFYPLLSGLDVSQPVQNIEMFPKDGSKEGGEYYDHIVVNQDLSNVEAVLQWCHDNDDLCARIALNATLKHDYYMSQDGILDYLEYTLGQIGERFDARPLWSRPSGISVSESNRGSGASKQDSPAGASNGSHDGGDHEGSGSTRIPMPLPSWNPHLNTFQFDEPTLPEALRGDYRGAGQRANR